VVSTIFHCGFPVVYGCLLAMQTDGSAYPIDMQIIEGSLLSHRLCVRLRIPKKGTTVADFIYAVIIMTIIMCVYTYTHTVLC
jgi:hypothetical protein